MKAKNAKHKTLKRNVFDSNAYSFAKSKTFIRYYSFHDNVVNTAAIRRMYYR